MNKLIWLGASTFTDLPPSDKTILRAHDEAENIIYQIQYEGIKYQLYPWRIVGDIHGHLYVSVYTDYPELPNSYFRKYRQTGDMIPFPNLHGARIEAICLDASGNIYIGGLTTTTSFYWLRKYDPDGNLLWSKSPVYLTLDLSGRAIRTIKIDSAGDIVVLGNAYHDTEIAKYDSDGNLIWCKAFNGQGWSICIDSSDNIYAGAHEFRFSRYYPSGQDWDDYDTGYIAFDICSIIKLDSSGNLIDSNYGVPSPSVSINQIEFANGLIHAYCANGSERYFYMTFDTGLSTATTVRDFGYVSPWSALNHMAVTQEGTAYFIGDYSYLPLGNYIFAIAVAENLQLPSLKIQAGLATPTIYGDAYAHVPGLPVTVALRVPDLHRDYVGILPLPRVYRLYLTGSPDIELPLESLSLRKGNGVSSLTVVCPGLTLAQIAAIEARATGTLILKHGVRLASGVEMIDALTVAPLTALRWDAGAKSASATLEGRETALEISAHTRTLRGISYRNSQDGLRRVRCEIDTYLNPGDTADLGAGETMIVAEITITASVGQAFMEVAETGA